MAKPKLSVDTTVLAYDDTSSSNPRRKFVDWRRSVSGVECEGVFSDRVTLDPGSSLTIAGSAPTSHFDNPAGAASGFDFVKHPVRTGLVMMKKVAAFMGTGLATAIGVAASTIQVTATDVTAVEFVVSAGAQTFADLAPGDKFYLPSTALGDAGPWGTTNQGFWEVVRVTASGSTNAIKMVAKRIYAGDSAVTETVVLAAASHLVKSADAADVHKYLLLAGNVDLAGLFTVEEVTTDWIAFAPNDSNVEQYNASLTLAWSFKQYAKYLRIESDQQVSVRLGLGTDKHAAEIVPVSAGDAAQVGWFENHGLVVQAVVTNHAQVAANVSYVIGYPTYDAS